jgi:hypothetical protein
MVIYEVNAIGPFELRDEYGALVRSHIQVLLQQKGFLNAEWYERDPHDEELPDGTFLWTMHYRVENRRALDEYIQGIGQELRNEAKEKFGGRIRVTRRILSLLSTAGFH